MGNIAILIVLGVGQPGVPLRARSPSGRSTAFLLYLTLLFAPVQQLSQVFDTYQQASAGLRKISGVLNTPVDTPDAEHPIEPGRLRGRVRFSGVRFRYAATTEALAGVDLEIHPGETVALVGETGAGKSTVVKLIARFYDPTAGSGHRRRPRAHRARPRRLSAPARLRAPGAVPVPGHHPRQHRLRAPRGHRRRGGGRRPRRRRARLHRRGRRLPASRSPSAAGRSRSASASCCAWPAPSSSTRRSCCSTRRRPTSTSPPRPRSTGRWASSRAAARRSSSPTACRPPSAPTASS